MKKMKKGKMKKGNFFHKKIEIVYYILIGSLL